MIAFVYGTSPSCWPQRFCFLSRRSTALIPLGLGLALLFCNCSLLSAARLKRHGPFAGARPLMRFCTGGLQSSPLRTGPALSHQLEERSWIPSLRGYPPPPAVLPAAPLRLYHIEPLLLRCCSSYLRLNAVTPRGAAVELLHRLVAARGVSNARIMGVHDVESHDELICDIGVNTQNFSGRRSCISFMKTSFKMGGSPLMSSAGRTAWAGLSRAVQW
jgi:hypothetical protein